MATSTAFFLATHWAYAGTPSPGTHRVRRRFGDDAGLAAGWLAAPGLPGAVPTGFDPDADGPCSRGPWARVDGYEYVGAAPAAGEYEFRGAPDLADAETAAWVGYAVGPEAAATN